MVTTFNRVSKLMVAAGINHNECFMGYDKDAQVHYARVWVRNEEVFKKLYFACSTFSPKDDGEITGWVTFKFHALDPDCQVWPFMAPFTGKSIDLDARNRNTFEAKVHALAQKFNG